MTKDLWSVLDEKSKKKQLREWLQQLADIEHGRHALCGKPDQGKLCTVKKDLESLVIATVEWEKPEEKKNR